MRLVSKYSKEGRKAYNPIIIFLILPFAIQLLISVSIANLFVPEDEFPNKKRKIIFLIITTILFLAINAVIIAISFFGP